MTKPCVFAVLGAGSWGTAVAIHLARAGHQVLLWGRSTSQIKQMQQEKMNAYYLPDQILPDTIFPTSDLQRCIKEADELCIAVPSHAFSELGEVLLSSRRSLSQGFFWLTKGLDPKTHLPFSDWVAEKFGKDYPCGILSGPSFAKEVAKGLPTALTFASNNLAYQQRLLKYFHQGAMRVYLTQDLIGVQICGAIKNVLAVACGISDGLQFGANAKAALITRGLAEMKRLGLVMGGKEQTFVGLAGLGDLVLTCTDNQSRNRRFGLELGQGKDCQTAMDSIGQVVEGYHNASQIYTLAQTHHVSMPICDAVYQVVQLGVSAQDAAEMLIKRTSTHQE